MTSQDSRLTPQPAAAAGCLGRDSRRAAGAYRLPAYHPVPDAACPTRTPATRSANGTASKATHRFASRPARPSTQTGNFVHVGLPYGEKPRLVLIHLASEAVRTGNPVVDVEDTMTSFARSLGLETNGQQLKGLKDQLARLASATIRMGVVEEGRAVQVNTQIVSSLRPVVPQTGRSTCTVAIDRSTERGVFPEPGQARRPARPPGRRCAVVVVDGTRCLRLACSAAAPDSIGQATTDHLGSPCTSSSGRGSPGSGISAGNFLQTLHQVMPPTRTHETDDDEVGLSLCDSPPPVAPRHFWITAG